MIFCSLIEIPRVTMAAMSGRLWPSSRFDMSERTMALRIGAAGHICRRFLSTRPEFSNAQAPLSPFGYGHAVLQSFPARTRNSVGHNTIAEIAWQNQSNLSDANRSFIDV